MISVTVSPVGKPPSFARGLPVAIKVHGEQPTVADIKQSIMSKFPKFHASRQKITLKGDGKMLADDTRLSDAGIVEGSEVSVKDLGPQISWRVVFLVEYLGPLVIHPLIYHFPALFYGRSIQHSLLQQHVFTLVVLHFVKRELETLFVHRFSHATMPARNIFKNSAHYYLLSGIALALDVYRQQFSASSPYIRGTFRDDPRFLWACTSVWFFAEVSNLHSHLTLRALRPAGTRKRAIPSGYGFTYVSCPNYFFESIAWLCICVMTGSYAAWTFTVVAVAQMASWAIKKHKNYKTEFGKQYPKERAAMIPFML